MKSAIILCTLAVAAYCVPTSTTKPEGGVKEAPADGHRRHRGWGGYGYSNPIVDRNVCDLDASVLVVVEGGRRGYNKARRVKCADVASADEDSCMVCCQNAARRDSSIRNEDIFGFLTVIDGFNKDSHESWSRESHGDDYVRESKKDTRPKRQSDNEYTGDETDVTSEPATAQDAEYGRKEEPLENFEPIKNFRNLKCLCCAPRRQLPPRPVIAVPVPQYPQPAAAPAPYQAQPTYQVSRSLRIKYRLERYSLFFIQLSYYFQAPAQYQPAQAQPTYQAQPSYP
ncbi:hypothetical protein PMAYCL1PPCAC_19104, partial [Pristionchus mayeri]